ncbi:uncharacterized protein LOC114352579 [Ostrinia furnacalis]|uniref:uncharacterized protein LOC114352579 n=1 Tax=Ostrinia furnacalis TaxID=93504 RepID=UPI00103E274E|nr:uncharacterized protein LOC114352579 [Ostrinia furnacalis]
MIASEYISKNILDTNLYETFSLVRTVQFVLGSCRVDVTDRFVSLPTVYQKIYTLLMLLIVAMLYVAVHFTYLSKYTVNANLHKGAVSTLVIHFLAYLFNMIHVRFVNNIRNVEFVISMQELDRSMKLEHNNSINSIVRKISVISTTLLTLGLIATIVTATVFLAMPVMLIVVTVTLSEVTNILDLSHCSTLMAYYTIRIRFVNSIIDNHTTRISKYYSYDTIIYSKNYMRELAAKTHDLRYSETDIYLKEIIKSFSKFRSLYQFQMLVFICKMITAGAIYLQVVTTGLQFNLIGILEWITIG